MPKEKQVIDFLEKTFSRSDRIKALGPRADAVRDAKGQSTFTRFKFTNRSRQRIESLPTTRIRPDLG